MLAEVAILKTEMSSLSIFWFSAVPTLLPACDLGNTLPQCNGRMERMSLREQQDGAESWGNICPIMLLQPESWLYSQILLPVPERSFASSLQCSLNPLHGQCHLRKRPCDQRHKASLPGLMAWIYFDNCVLHMCSQPQVIARAEEVSSEGGGGGDSRGLGRVILRLTSCLCPTVEAVCCQCKHLFAGPCCHH